jgi:hypothetical protein
MCAWGVQKAKKGKRMKLRSIAIATFAAAMLASPALAEKVTNQSVIDLTKAKMSDDIIISAIDSGTPAFDTSSKGLIALKKAGVSDKVVQAILSASAAPTQTASAAPRSAAGGMTPEHATLIDGGKSVQMKYLTPSIRHVVAPFAGARSYASLTGMKATQRTSGNPKFIIAVPNNAQPESYFTIAHLEAKKGVRSVLVGGGYYSYTTGITKDRVVPVTSTKAASQGGAPAGFTLYELTPTSELAPGEYALVLYSSVVRSSGWFDSGQDSYFDFGVD